MKNWLLQVGDPSGVSGAGWAKGWTGNKLKALAAKSPEDAIAAIQAEARAAGIDFSHLQTNGLASHGNSRTAAGPHDVYVVRDADTGELLHFGETGRGFEGRFVDHQRTTFKDSGRSLDVELLRTVEGKDAAKALETRYITTYTRVFGQRPPFNPVDH